MPTTKTPRAPKLPKTPANLCLNARQLWANTVAEFELDTFGLLLLEQACRELTLIERMDTDIQALESLTVEGSMGQPVVTELAKEIRQHRGEFTRLKKALNLPDEDAAGSRSVQAREAANRRWRMSG